MLNVRVDNVWLRFIGGYSDLTMSHTWPGGSESLTWTMNYGTQHPALTAGATVECFDGGIPAWLGKLSQPGENGELSATGLSHAADNVYALDGSDNASNTPDDAIDAAIARGAIPWIRPASLSAVAWGTPDKPMLLPELLDKSMAGLGLRWWVDEFGAVRAGADPTEPTFYVPRAAAGYGLTLVDDTYYTRLIGSYTSSTGPATETVGSGSREATVDLTPMGEITALEAVAQLQSRLDQSGARYGFAESLNLGYGQLTTPGGTLVPLSMPRAGQMIRLEGVRNPDTGASFYDIVVGRSVYKDGDATVQLSPVGLAARNLTDVLQVAVA